MTFALTHLYDAVVARFEQEGTNVPNLFGWRKPPQREITGPRITWYPGDPNGALGTIGPAKQPGRNPRSLGTVNELFTVEIHGEDPSAPNDERKQYEATRLLYDAWYRAVYLAARGTFTITTPQWITDKKEFRNGAAIRVVGTIEAMIPDVTQKIAPVDVRAVVDAEQLDVTETITVPEDP